MRENYTPRIIMIIVVLLTSLYVALPSLGVFPKVLDYDRNGIINDVDFKEYHRLRLQKDTKILENATSRKMLTTCSCSTTLFIHPAHRLYPPSIYIALM